MIYNKSALPQIRCNPSVAFLFPAFAINIKNLQFYFPVFIKSGFYIRIESASFYTAVFKQSFEIMS